MSVVSVVQPPHGPVVRASQHDVLTKRKGDVRLADG